MLWIHINFISVAYLKRFSIDQIGSFVTSFNAKYVSHLQKTGQLQGAKPPDPQTRGKTSEPTGTKVSRSPWKSRAPRSPWICVTKSFYSVMHHRWELTAKLSLPGTMIIIVQLKITNKEKQLIYQVS